MEHGFWHNGDGLSEECDSGVISRRDHPAFAALRDSLSKNGYIEVKPWCNGDVVLKEFEFNGHLFEVGEGFPCAAAISHMLGYPRQEDRIEYFKREIARLSNELCDALDERDRLLARIADLEKG